MSLVIRRARAERVDAVKLYNLLCEMYPSVGLDIPRPVKNRIFARIRSTVEDGVAFLAEKDGEAVGTIGLLESPAWWSDRGPISDTFFYVRASSRAGGTAKALVTAAKNYAAQKEKKLVIGLLTGVDLFKKELFLARMGGQKIGAAYAFA